MLGACQEELAWPPYVTHDAEDGKARVKTLIPGHADSRPYHSEPGRTRGCQGQSCVVEANFLTGRENCADWEQIGVPRAVVGSSAAVEEQLFLLYSSVRISGTCRAMGTGASPEMQGTTSTHAEMRQGERVVVGQKQAVPEGAGCICGVRAA